MFYSQLSDLNGYFSILPISPTESEAAYVLDGLFEHEAALECVSACNINSSGGVTRVQL
jgi:TnpA family transposase